MSDPRQHVHLLTFDLEHWYEGYRYRGYGGWADIPPRDPDTVQGLLELLANTGQRATFFTTGRFATEFPHVVRSVATSGHEVASHSYEHIPIERLETAPRFREDLRRSLGVLEDLTAKRVTGFRAPKWSMSSSNLAWVYDVLGEEGLTYDSSRFPALLERKTGDGLTPERVTTHQGQKLWEIPPSVFAFGPVRLRAAGGLYLRLFPEWLTRATIRRAASQGRPGLVYLHPYDLDPDCPRLPSGRLFAYGRHFGLSRSRPILTHLLTTFQFVTIREWLDGKLCEANDL